MKFFTIFSVITLICSMSHVNAQTNYQCPQVPQILSTMKCQQVGASLYKCNINHHEWESEFESKVDVTKTPGYNAYVGRHPGDICSYKYQTPNLEVNYTVTHK